MAIKDPDEVREIFNHFDRDGNGTIDRREWGSLLEALDSGFTEEEAAAGLDAVDVNRNGKIELREFIKWWTEQP
jgi:Ca2+-binding EF-hand superfamily protein